VEIAALPVRGEYPTARELTEKIGGKWNERMRRGNGRCPAHNDADPSLDITERNGTTLLICRAGCSQDRVIDALRTKGLWPERRVNGKANGHATPSRIIATYDYHDAEGILRFQAVRYGPKKMFRQRRPDPSGNGWVWTQPIYEPHRYLPYCLPDLLEAIALGKSVFVVEGEKDVENARSKLGITATCNACGAGKWDARHAAYLANADVNIIPDNDDAGLDHAEDVAESLQGIAKSTRIVPLPNLPEKGDLSDWIDAGGTAEQLWTLVEKAPEWRPSTEPSRRRERRAGSGAIRITRGSSVKPERITWVWPGRIARGKHTALAGEPGVGKSTLLYGIAATITTGGQWPAGEGRAPKGSVVLLSAEDGPADTIVPRFLAAGGDSNKLHIVTAVEIERDGVRGFNLQADLAALEAKICEIGDVVLVIIDPISSYLGGTDSHKNADVRGSVDPLNAMADRLGVSIVSNSHFSKSGAASSSRALHRFIGSIAFVASPRVAFAVVDDGETDEEGNLKHPGRKLLLHVKSNIGPAPQGLAYRLEQRLATDIGDPPEPLYASCVAWETEPVTKTADQAISEHEGSLRTTKGARPSPERDRAEAFLRSWLKYGQQPAKEVTKAAREAGINPKPLREARERICATVEVKGDDGRILRHEWALKGAPQPKRDED
jgi:putative DNA primase/helicase